MIMLCTHFANTSHCARTLQTLLTLCTHFATLLLYSFDLLACFLFVAPIINSVGTDLSIHFHGNNLFPPIETAYPINFSPSFDFLVIYYVGNFGAICFLPFSEDLLFRYS